MRKLLLLFSIYFVSVFKLSAQTQATINEAYIDKKLDEITYNPHISEPEKEKAFLKLKAESEKIQYNWGILKSGRRLIDSYLNQNKNKEIIKLATELKKINAGKQADRTMANIYRSNALALGYLGFDEESLKDFKTAINYAERIKDPNIRNYTLATSYQNITLYYFNKRLEKKSYRDSVFHYLNKSLATAKLIKDNNPEITASLKYDHISFNNIRSAIMYLEEANKPGNIQLAEKYLTESLDIVNKYNLVNADKVLLLNQLSWLYLEKKDYQKTVEYANLAKDLEKKFHDPDNRVESFEFLANAYAGLGDNKSSKLYMDKYSSLKDSITISQKNNADYSFNVLLSDSKATQEKKSWINIIIISVISLLLLILVTLYWKRKNKIVHQKYEELISKIKIKAEENPLENNNITKVIKETEAGTLIQELENFEKSELYLQKDFSLNWLANHLGTSPTHLSETVKTHRNKTFTEYINSLKINYVIHKLVTNPDYRKVEIDDLAEKHNFNSRKVFVAAFKNETGITPSYFINNLKKDNLYLKL